MGANTQVQRLMNLVDACEGTFHAVVALGIENKPRHMAAREELRSALRAVLDQRDELLAALKGAGDVIALLAINCCDRVDVSEDPRLAAISAAITKTEAS